MEPVIFDQSPLAEYLRDEGDDQQQTWVPTESRQNVDTPPPSPPSPPTHLFAPVGRPLVKKRFRDRISTPLRVSVPRCTSIPSSLNDSYAKAVASRIDRADNAKFLEKFRYTIIASQLLSGHSILNNQPASTNRNEAVVADDASPSSVAGVCFTAAAALTLAWLISWIYSGGYSQLSKKRVVVVLVLVVAAGAVGQAYVRQQWLRYLRVSALKEVTTFVTRSQDYDSASSAAVALVQEVELVSRGYRISVPLPPISRIEDRSQSRRCVRLRKALTACFKDAVQKYSHTASVIRGFAEQIDLDKYYDIYDISDFDMADAQQGFSDSEFDDAESLRTLKIVAARFHTLRKMFLCALLALEVNGDDSDSLRWTTAVESLRLLNHATRQACERLSVILREEESFPSVPITKMPLSPNREKWRSQLGKINSLSTGIRGLQAKLALLREESDNSLNQAADVSELAPNLLAQYESIGEDLKILTQAWEEGKQALASGIDRNEKRLSSLSGLLSPATSLSGLTTVEEGDAADALRALNGDTTPSKTKASPKESTPEEEIFEAVAMPRPRSLLSRDERIVKMKEDRDRRAEAREAADANRGMLRELETVINLRPKRRSLNITKPGRVSL